MSKLKGVIFGIRDVIVKEGKLDVPLLNEIGRLVTFLRSQGIQPVFLSNNEWHITENSTRKPLDSVLNSRWGASHWYIHKRDGTPPKPQANAVINVLTTEGWEPTEVVYIGNTEDDMRTAVNGNLLFLNATWYGKNTSYGFEFTTPMDIGRFIGTFCLRDHLWHYKIEEQNFKFFALSPFSTYYKEFSYYSEDARGAAKWGGGHPDFWTKYLWSTIYFSGLHYEFDYATAYPGHKAGSYTGIMAEPLLAFARCFRKTFIPNLIVRHKDALKSAKTRAAGGTVDHLNQLNTISLNPNPNKSNGDPYKTFPLKRGKTVLVVDDFCTRGFSLEAARAFIEQTGAKVICLSWLKTINSPYTSLCGLKNFDPFKPCVFPQLSASNLVEYPYKNHICDPSAPEEIEEKLRVYDAWKWPE